MSFLLGTLVDMSAPAISMQQGFVVLKALQIKSIFTNPLSTVRLAMMIITRPATEADLDAISRVSNSAFDPDTHPVTSHTFPRHLRPAVSGEPKESTLWKLEMKTAALSNSRSIVTVAVDKNSDRIVGVSVWSKPAILDDSSSNQPRRTADTNSTSYASFDSDAMGELRTAIQHAIATSLGDQGFLDVWCKRWTQK